MMYERLKFLLKRYGIVLGLGLGYYFFVTLTGLKIPCIFYELTGHYCPGCGITRMCVALLKLDFEVAAGHNLLVFCLLPFGIFLFIYKTIEFILKGETQRRMWENLFYIIAFVLCIVFCVLRNMEQFAFLAP